MSEWPLPSAPMIPPKVNWYFTRMVGSQPKQTMVTNFAELWQMGLYLEELFKPRTDVEIEDVDDGSHVTFSVITGWDPDGTPSRSRHFDCRLRGATVAQCLKAAKSHADSELPPRERRSMAQAYGSDKPTTAPAVTPAPPRAPTPRAPAAPRVARQPRREGSVTLGSLCDEARVDAGQVRAELRKRKIEKPEGGWTFDPSDERLDVVKEIIRSVKG